MGKEKFFVDSAGNVSDSNKELLLNDPVSFRDSLEREASSADEVKRKILSGQSEAVAREEFIVGRLSLFPLPALQKLLQQRPADNLAYRALKKQQDRNALRAELIEKGKMR